MVKVYSHTIGLPSSHGLLHSCFDATENNNTYNFSQPGLLHSGRDMVAIIIFVLNNGPLH